MLNDRGRLVSILIPRATRLFDENELIELVEPRLFFTCACPLSYARVLIYLGICFCFCMSKGSIRRRSKVQRNTMFRIFLKQGVYLTASAYILRAHANVLVLTWVYDWLRDKKNNNNIRTSNGYQMVWYEQTRDTCYARSTRFRVTTNYHALLSTINNNHSLKTCSNSSCC